MYMNKIALKEYKDDIGSRGGSSVDERQR